MKLNKIRIFLNSRKKMSCLIIILVITALVSLCVFFGVNNRTAMSYVSDRINVEYGDSIPNDIHFYLKDAPSEIEMELSKNAKISISDSSAKPDIGEYSVSVSYGQETKNVNVIVSDTVKPTFEGDFSKLETYKGVDIDLESIKVIDESETNIVIDLSKVDIDKVGEYKTTITSSDSSGNENTIDTVVIVKENEISLSKEKLTLQKGDTEKIKVDIKGKSQDVNFKSSNSSVAKVDENGNVTAISKGNADVVADCNGVSDSCKVTVEDKNTSNSSKDENNNNSSSATNNSKPSNSNDSNSSGKNESTSNDNNSSSSENKPSKPTSLNANTISYLKASKSSDNILVVSSTKKSNRNVTISYYQKSSSGWKQTFKVSGIVGKEGIGKGKEGDKRTPIGIYSITKLFGIDSNPGTQLPYHKLTGSEYWCGGSNHYNQWIDESVQEHNCDRSNDEHLIDYPINYDYAAALNYNPSNTYGKGSAIFVHCKKGSYTGGCVAMPKSNMRTFMRGINSSTRVIIDLDTNIFNY